MVEGEEGGEGFVFSRIINSIFSKFNLAISRSEFPTMRGASKLFAGADNKPTFNLSYSIRFIVFGGRLASRVPSLS